jgi:feruloyl esterase
VGQRSRRGFASASTDTGHDAAKEPLAAFAYVTPENPHGRRKLLDFAYLSVHNTAVFGQAVIQAYYGKAPRLLLLGGMLHWRPPGNAGGAALSRGFDGLVIGAPGLYLTGNVTRRLWVGQSQVGAGAIPVEKLPLLNRVVYGKL